MAFLYPEIQVTNALNLHATVKVNKEAIHIMADVNYSFYKLLGVTLRHNSTFTQHTKMFQIKHSNSSKLQ
jgi:hypothetical protein